MDRAVIAALAGVLLAAPLDASAQTLKGSKRTMARQNRVAVQHDYTFLQTSAEVRRFVASGYLVRLPGNADYQLASVSHPYARPQVRTFVERLGAQHRDACGEKLVITSLTRPAREQPRNASDLSVHPTGMAVDLRISRKSSCRRWLEKTLLTLEKQGILDATREKRPPHFHVALFPATYEKYLATVTRSVPSSARVAAATVRSPQQATRRLTTASTPRPAPLGAGGSPAARSTAPAGVTLAHTPTATTAPASESGAAGSPDGAQLDGADATAASTGPQLASDRAAVPASHSPPLVDEHGLEVAATLQKYRVARGETMWSIARRHGTTVQMIMALNGLLTPGLSVGQIITVPVPPSPGTETSR